MAQMDKERFVSRVLEMEPALYRTARSILRSEQDAQDAVQEAVTQAYARLHTLRDPEKFKPWLLRIAVNACYDVCRRRRTTVDIAAVEETLAAPQSDCVERMSLWNAVQRLPEEQKAVVTLFYYEDLSIRAISEVLGVTQGTVKTRLSRARGRLRRLIEQQGGV